MIDYNSQAGGKYASTLDQTYKDKNAKLYKTPSDKLIKDYRICLY
jgi:hypothetical protein